MPIGAKIFDIAFAVFIYLLAAAILVGAILFAFSASPSKSLFGYRYYNILTPSMEPTYKVGDLVFVKICDGKDINVGDVITYNPSTGSDAYLTHRVTKKFDNYENTGKVCFNTKGDANNTEDGFLIDEDRVVGKVTFGVPGLGFVIAFIKTRWYLILLIVVMIAVFLQLLKRYFLLGKEDDGEDDKDKDKKDKKSKKKKSKESLPDAVTSNVNAEQKLPGQSTVKEPEDGAVSDSATAAEKDESTPDSDADFVGE